MSGRAAAAGAASAAPDRTLIAADAAAVVVVPARDEAARIGACLEALAGQEVDVPFVVVLVLDACADATEAAAAAVARRRPGLRLAWLHGPGRGVGAARALGMDLARDALLAAGRPDGLIATTDADSRVAPGWLRAQLEAVARGAEAIGGRIELCEIERRDLAPGVLRLRTADQRRRFDRVLALEPEAEHWQFSGASMAVTARAYDRVGGLEPLVALEDEAFERRLRAHGIPIVRSRAVQVTTSARVAGRAPAGLAHDLARLALASDPGVCPGGADGQDPIVTMTERPEHTEQGYPEEAPPEVVPDEQTEHRHEDGDADRAPDNDDGTATGNEG